MSGNGTKISLEALKALRQKTGAGVMECRRALEAADGRTERAEAILADRAREAAARRASSWTGEGYVASYVHHTGKLGALVELGCRTDFVARTAAFRELADRIAEQIAAVPAEAGGEPLEALLTQAWIRNPDTTLGQLLEEAAMKFGEPVRVRRFVRFSLEDAVEPS